EAVEADLARCRPEGLGAAEVARLDVRAPGLDREGRAVGHLDLEIGARAAAEQAHADVEAAALVEVDAVVTDLDVEDVRERLVVEGSHPNRVALDAADENVARRLAEREAAAWADPLLQCRAGCRGLAHRSVLPMARMAAAASSAPISRRARRSRTSWRLAAAWLAPAWLAAVPVAS